VLLFETCRHADTSKKKPKKDTAAAPRGISRKQEPADTLAPAALETTEILEQVLTYLSPQQLFSVQRVSRTWKSVIADSLAIQQKLFLRLHDKPKETWMLFSLRTNVNDVRLEKFSPTKPEDLYWTSLGKKFSPVMVNPFLQATRWSGPSCVRLGYTIPTKSSLLDTYVSDPPCDTAWILATFYPSRSGSRIHASGLGSRIPDYLLCAYRMRSTKNLTIRRAIARPVDSTTVDAEIVHTVLGRVSRRGMLGQIVRQLEIEHQCQFVSDPSDSVIRLEYRDIAPFLLIHAESEWKALKRTLGV
jgi:hypothetical protein